MNKYGHIIGFGNEQKYKLVIDKDSLEILESSKAAVDLYGYEYNTFIGMTFTELCPSFSALKEKKSVHLTNNEIMVINSAQNYIASKLISTITGLF